MKNWFQHYIYNFEHTCNMLKHKIIYNNIYTILSIWWKHDLGTQVNTPYYYVPDLFLIYSSLTSSCTGVREQEMNCRFPWTEFRKGTSVPWNTSRKAIVPYQHLNLRAFCVGDRLPSVASYGLYEKINFYNYRSN